MNKRIAFFDFDGTITTKDTLLEFIRYDKGAPLFWLGFLLSAPWILAYKLKVISNQKGKERVLSFFFKNRPLDDFQASCDRFSSEMLPGLLRPKALDELKKLKELGAEIVIVSASPSNWIRKWADSIGASLIATHLSVTTKKGRTVLTGSIEGANCHGREKVRRIQLNHQLDEYTEIYAYGDSSGDRPMLALGKIAFYKPFR
ncbi:MAG: haloacid dehalogenase-like hydrolase [Bacteroidetes bacterium]|nr:haloacid dehalogenase-like hydrolase [Bacteroidota bacterium]